MFRFRKKKLALAIAVATGMPTIALSAAEIEEVVVSGIRASVQRSMDIKRDSDGIVDAITAEDMGKFPDSNLAESLQRISGVSIDRRNGEGSQVTVRGFGPAFNMVTLNGRYMPSSSLDQNISGGADSSSRAFDMDNLASEGVSGVEVYKTSNASVASGGIGATINILTARPMDTEGLRVSVGTKALQDSTNVRGSDITSEFSGLASWSNDTFGVLANFSTQERDSSVTGAFVNSWSANQAYTGTYPRGAGANIENEPALGEIVGDPTSIRYFHSDHERTRKNAQLVFQFAPTDRINATLDYTLAEQELVQNRNELSLWFQDGNFPRTDLVFDDDANSPTPVLYWEQGPAARDISFAMQEQDQINEMESIGFNLEYQLSDALSIALDIHDSSSESKPNNDRNINWANVSIGAVVSPQQGADYSTDIPVAMLVIDDSAGNGNGVVDLSEVGSQVFDVRRESAKTDISQFRLDATYEFSDTAKIDFGIESRSLEHSGSEAQKQQLLGGGWGIANPGDVPDGLLESIDYNDLFDNALVPSDAGFFSDASGGAAQPLTQSYYGNTRALGIALAAQGGPNGEVRTYDVDETVPDGVSRAIEEDVTAIYFQMSTESELGDMPVSISAGLRYEDTDVTSSANVAVPIFNWQANQNFLVSPIDATNTQVFSENASYDHLLPNLDIAVHINEDVVTRFSYSKTIARASFAQMDSAVNVNSGGHTQAAILGSASVPGSATTGTPGILPLESDNFDVSVEYYFDDTSYVSVGFFDKRVSNFIGSQPVLQTVYGITDPTNGARAAAAQTQLIADGRDVNSTNLFIQMAATEAGEAFDARTQTEWENDVDFIGDATDPEAIFSVSTPTNVNTANINGWELAGQHFFGDTGFGIQANYTIVNGDVDFDNSADPSTGAQFALVGLSDTANLSFIYENYGFSGRLSWNWRDEFLNDTAVNGNEPEYTEAYEQLDLSVSYEMMDGLFVSFDGLNLTGEDQRKHGRSDRQLTQYSQLGARYALGLRYNF